MTTEKADTTSQEKIKYDIQPRPVELLGIVFDGCTGAVPDNPQIIARAFVSKRDLSCLAPLFPDPEEDDLNAEGRIAGLVHDFIAAGKTNGNRSATQEGILVVKRGAPDLVKSNLPEHSPWVSTVSSCVNKASMAALRSQVRLIEQALLS